VDDDALEISALAINVTIPEVHRWTHRGSDGLT
jgi:hypothetical protein